MASLDELHDHLTQLQAGLDELRELIVQLATAKAPPSNDGKTNTATDDYDDDDLLDDEAVADLAAEIADTLRETQDGYEMLQEDAIDLGVPINGTSSGTRATVTATTTAPDLHDRQRFQEGLARLGYDLKGQHGAFRRARLQAKQVLDAARERERREMLEEYAHPESESETDEEEEEGEKKEEPRSTHHHRRHRLLPTSTARPQSKTVAAAADVTAALRATHARITGEVARSEFAAQTLEESSRALAELGDRYHKGGDKGSIGASLVAARGMVRGLVAAHKSDTWYLQSALVLLLGTAAWLVFRRVLFGPLWLLLWWPLRTLYGTARLSGRGLAAGGRLLAADGQSNGNSLHLTSSSILDIPTTTAMVAPVASVSPDQAGDVPRAPADSLVEEVGRIVDGTNGEASQQQQQEQQQEQEQPQPNRKKRMWEEDKEAAKYAEQQENEKKDEL